MTNENSLDCDPRYWHNVQPPEEIDVSGNFEYDEDATSLLRKWLRLDEAVSKTIVEVGCGSGYQAKKAYLSDLVRNPERISKTHELQTTSGTVTTGFKP